MPNTIKVKSSGTTGATPTSLAVGELALNYSDGLLFYRNSSNQIVSLATGGGGSSTHDHDNRYYTETEIDAFLSGKLDISGTTLSGSRTLYVDGARTDTYTADGTILRPFKTIQAAHDYAVTITNGPPSTAWLTGQVVIRINAGNYSENLTVTRSNIHFVGAGGAKTRDVIIEGRVTLNINENPGVTRDNNLVSFSNLIVLGSTNTTNTMFIAGGAASYLLFFANMHLSNPSGAGGGATCKTFEVTNTSADGIRVEIRNMLLGQGYSSLVAMDFNNVSAADIDWLSATSLGTVMELKTTYAIIGNSKFQTTSTSSAVAVIRAISSFPGSPATLVLGTSILSNSNTNGDGLYIASGAVANVAHVAFNVGTALGTGFAVNGVTGATLISAANTFGVLPVSPFATNNKVATAITNASLGTSLTRSGVALDTRTPASHTHGNITNAGAIGSTANLPIITTTSGVLATGSFGTGANTFCAGNDSRLTDSRTPTAHKASHATGGTDALTPADIGAASASHTHTSASITDFSTAVAAASPEEVVEFLTPANFPATGNSSLLYISTDSGRAYRWVGSQYAEVGPTSLFVSAHVHSASDITSGTLDIARIPTGTTSTTVCIGNDARLSDTRTPTDGTVTTAKLADGAVTYAKVQNVSATDRLLGRSSAGAGVVEEITCTSFGRSLIDDADASTARTTLGLQYATAAEALGRRTTGTATANTSTLTVASSTGINNGDLVTGPGIQADTTVVSGGGTTTLSLSKATGAALSSTPVVFYRHDRTLSPGTVAGGMCRAWVNFNGTGTVAIRAAYNVTSITDNGVGNYTVNFGSDMPDTNYCVLANHSALVGDFRQGIQAVPSSITQATVLTYSNNAAQDPANVFVAVFR